MKNLHRIIEVAQKFSKYEGWYIHICVNIHGHDEFSFITYNLTIMEPGQSFKDDNLTHSSINDDEETIAKWITYLECKLEYLERMVA